MRSSRLQVAKDLLTDFCTMSRDKGFTVGAPCRNLVVRLSPPTAMLWPFRPDFYKAMGFGYGPKAYEYKCAVRGAQCAHSRLSAQVQTLEPSR